MSEKPAQDLTEILARIPIFAELSLDQVRKVLAICGRASFPKGKTIYAAGTPGNELLILLKGTVSIQMPDGSEITQVVPIDTVGEMEIASSHSRTARAVADEAVSGLTMGQAELEGLVNVEPLIVIKVLRNIINILAEKIKSMNEQLAEKEDSKKK